MANQTSIPAIALCLVLCGRWCAAQEPGTAPVDGTPWTRHTIDNTSLGADGSRPFDVNGDSWMDLVVPWEEGGEIRLYLHPGPDAVRDPWPHVTVGRVASPEDAVCVDLDRDGAVDVVSCTEGTDRSIYVHWAPTSPVDLLDAGRWVTEPLPAARGQRQWMFALPADIDGRHGIDLFAGSKNEGAMLGWFQAPENPRDLSAWTWHPVRAAAWTMTLHGEDFDGDGLADVVYSERRGPLRGCWWLRHPGFDRLEDPWTAQPMGGNEHEVMFMAPAVAGPGERAFVAATSGGPVLWCHGSPAEGGSWSVREIPMPPNAGTGKSAAVGDLDGDEQPDLVVSCENADGKHGVFRLSRGPEDRWRGYAVSGLEGAKFDLVVLLDVDGDGDLDIVTCEEKENLGVVWYENPRSP